MLLYGGIGLGVLGIVIAIVAYSMSGTHNNTTPAKSGGASHAESGKWTPPSDAPPYKSVGEAKTELSRAQKLCNQATASTSNLERNNLYKQAAYICERVLCTKGLSESTQTKAGMLKYEAKKHQTL